MTEPDADLRLAEGSFRLLPLRTGGHGLFCGGCYRGIRMMGEVLDAKTFPHAEGCAVGEALASSAQPVLLGRRSPGVVH